MRNKKSEPKVAAAEPEEEAVEVETTDPEVEVEVAPKDKLLHRRKIEDYLEAKRLRELCDDNFDDL